MPMFLINNTSLQCQFNVINMTNQSEKSPKCTSIYQLPFISNLVVAFLQIQCNTILQLYNTSYNNNKVYLSHEATEQLATTGKQFNNYDNITVTNG
jgi:hypothetical protein